MNCPPNGQLAIAFKSEEEQNKKQNKTKIYFSEDVILISHLVQ